ncbi:hypothetical protein P5673_012941, partial [Acropora cervicornis]
MVYYFQICLISNLVLSANLSTVPIENHELVISGSLEEGRLLFQIATKLCCKLQRLFIMTAKTNLSQMTTLSYDKSQLKKEFHREAFLMGREKK